jgi:hypothetical protein
MILNKYSGLLDAMAECRQPGCPWPDQTGRNAVGLAAQHAARTGHEVHAEQTIGVTWNRPSA